MTKSPILILHGKSQPYLSVGARAGGMVLNGKRYTYLPDTDAFLRNDHLGALRKMKKDPGYTWEKFIEYVKAIVQ